MGYILGKILKIESTSTTWAAVSIESYFAKYVVTVFIKAATIIFIMTHLHAQNRLPVIIFQVIRFILK